MLCVGEKLYLINKLIIKDISGRVWLARYINALIALSYGISEPCNSRSLKGSLFTVNDLQLLEYKNGSDLSM